MRLHVQWCAHGSASMYNKRKAQLKGLRSTLAIVHPLRSTVMFPSFVITNHELLERHSAVTIWEYSSLHLLQAPVNRPFRIHLSQTVDEPNQFSPLATAPTDGGLARRHSVDDFQAVVELNRYR